MDFYQIIQWMQGQLQLCNQRIEALENQLRCAEEEIEKLKEKPSIQVGTIQYKFDQLKVETLEGTLNIGLNPQDVQGIEDFAIQNGQPGTPMPPMEMMQRSLKMEEAVNEYLESGLPAFISEAGGRIGLKQPETYTSFITNDIKKQLPSRIEAHLKSINPSEADETAMEKAADALKKEIENGVLAFFNNLPGTMKGDPK
ncbi:spore germination protein GerPC [Bacillus sp. B-jedd]|uniref:spore germination protein GerPC n=1 Tax=Bacillus sp. B-jedd TaxID=1476857 RepID=UPI0005156ED7|nr:spore germination protein GerPC [Bacillus sp. B-jedd]CEG26041.1 spore germination protein [Bacillus sp. B-jedd]